MTEVRTLPVIGTHYVEHVLYLNGARIYSQLSPYSVAEIAERIARHKNPSVSVPIKSTSYHSKSGPKAPKYEWRTGVDEQ